MAEGRFWVVSMMTPVESDSCATVTQVVSKSQARSLICFMSKIRNLKWHNKPVVTVTYNG